MTFCLTLASFPQGSYSTSGQASCTPCPAGQSCADPAVNPVNCVGGTFAPPGSVVCKGCPAGFKCSSPSGRPEACPSGHISGSNQTSCSPCSQGKFCPAGNQAEQNCPFGTYSEAVRSLILARRVILSQIFQLVFLSREQPLVCRAQRAVNAQMASNPTVSLERTR